jgi:hypothetical protein
MMRDRHMDSDESVAFGAGLHAANMSTAFRVRKFGAVDAASYALTVEFDVAATETKETPEVSERGPHSTRCLGLQRCSAKLRTVLLRRACRNPRGHHRARLGSTRLCTVSTLVRLALRPKTFRRRAWVP